MIEIWSAGGQWQKAVEIFNSMERMGLQRDAITYSSVISALAKGKQWSMAIEVGTIGINDLGIT